MKIIKYIAGFILSCMLFTSCIKDDAPALGTKGSSFVKIMEAPENNLFFSPFSTVDTVDLLSLRREEVSSTALDASKTVKLEIIPDSITAYNDANGTNYELLPDSLYTIVGSDNVISGTSVSMTIPSDVIGSEFYIALNGAKWDVSHRYAMFLRISDAAGSNIRTGQSEVFVTLATKNQWDGVYSASGTMEHPTYGGTFTDKEETMATVGPNTVEFQLQTTVLFGVYVDLTIDPVTNLVTVESSGVVLDAYDPSKNYYDPAAKTFYLDFGYSDGSRHVTMTAVYDHPR